MTRLYDGGWWWWHDRWCGIRVRGWQFDARDLRRRPPTFSERYEHTTHGWAVRVGRVMVRGGRLHG